jgi:hypothetical protein
VKLPFVQMELFFERPAVHQRGWWVDVEDGQWITIALGGTLLTLARLPS